MKVLKYLLIVIMLYSPCCLNGQSFSYLKELYNKKEIEELNKLINFVFEEITKDCKASTKDCIDRYFNEFESLGATAVSLNLKISFKDQEKLLTSIDTSLFNDIWIYIEGEKYIGNDEYIKAKFLEVNPSGRFAKLLIKVTGSNERLKRYGEPYRQVQDYTPMMNSFLLKEHERFNFESKDELLLVAIHLLMLNHFDNIN